VIKPFFSLLFFASILTGDEIRPLKEALKKQSQHQSVVVLFRQTKKIPALTDEIKTDGKLWLIPGKSFRWELGKPAKKTVIYDGGDVLVLDEKKKTGKRLAPDHKTVKPLFLTLGMGQDASFEGLSKVFTITGTNEAKGRFVAQFSPKPRSLRRVIKSLLMQVNLETSFMERIGWIQKDGTETMTEFFKPSLNQKIPASTFAIRESDYTWE